jgi:hypothetical protein
VGRACGMHGRGEKQGFGGKAQRKKTKALMRGWDQNGAYGDLLGGGSGVDSLG